MVLIDSRCASWFTNLQCEIVLMLYDAELWGVKPRSSKNFNLLLQKRIPERLLWTWQFNNPIITCHIVSIKANTFSVRSLAKLKDLMEWSFIKLDQFVLNFQNSKIGKGQLISKCPFGVIVWTKIPTRISALASKKRLNQKLYCTNYVK